MADEGVTVTVTVTSDGWMENIKLEEPDGLPTTATAGVGVEFLNEYLGNEAETNFANENIGEGDVDPLMQTDDGQTESTGISHSFDNESVRKTRDETQFVMGVKNESVDGTDITVEDFQHSSFQREVCEVQNLSTPNRSRKVDEIALVREAKNSLINPLFVMVPPGKVIQENPAFVNETEENHLSVSETNYRRSVQDNLESAIESANSFNSNHSRASSRSSSSTTRVVTPNPQPAPAPAPKPTTNSKRSQLFCLPCDLFFKNQQELDEHLMTDHLYAFGCEVCNAHFTSKQVLTKHEKSHKINGINICPFCSVKIKAKYQMTNHLCEVHPIKPKMYGCTSLNCELLFENMKELLQHKLTNKHYKRPVGGNASNTWTGKCCEQIFTEYGLFKSHYDVFHQGQRVALPTNSGSNLNSGSRVSPSPHEVGINFSRYDCGGSIESSNSDKIPSPRESQEMSEEEKAENAAVLRQSPKCSICDATFITLVGLQNHVKKHHKVKFTCVSCQKDFVSEDLLISHHRNEHMGKRKRNGQVQGKNSRRSTSRTESVESQGNSNSSSPSSNYASTNSYSNDERNIRAYDSGTGIDTRPLTVVEVDPVAVSRNVNTFVHQSCNSTGTGTPSPFANPNRSLQSEPGSDRTQQSLVIMSHEIERLRNWFSINPNPSDHQLMLITRELNVGDHRVSFPLTEMFVRQWFEKFRNCPSTPNASSYMPRRNAPVSSNDSHGMNIVYSAPNGMMSTTEVSANGGTILSQSLSGIGGQAVSISNSGPTAPAPATVHYYPGLSVAVNYPAVGQNPASSSSYDPPPIYSTSTTASNYAPIVYPTLPQLPQYIPPTLGASTITLHGSDQNQMPIQMQSTAVPRNQHLSDPLHDRDNNNPMLSRNIQPSPMSYSRSQPHLGYQAQIVTNVSPWVNPGHQSLPNQEHLNPTVSPNNAHNSSFPISDVQPQTSVPVPPTRTWSTNFNLPENSNLVQIQTQQPALAEIELVEPAGTATEKTKDEQLLHPVKEVAKLLGWFDLNPRPTDQTIEAYTADLNAQSYRNSLNIPKLTSKVIKKWFKSTRLSLRRIEVNCSATTTNTTVTLPGHHVIHTGTGRTVPIVNNQQQVAPHGRGQSPSSRSQQKNVGNLVDTSIPNTFTGQGRPSQIPPQDRDPHHREFYNAMQCNSGDSNSSNVSHLSGGSFYTQIPTHDTSPVPQIVSVASLATGNPDSDQCSRVTSSQIENHNICKSSINKYLEVPKLLKWFERNPNPSSSEIALYAVELNKSDLRKDGPFLPRIAVSNFFKKLNYLRQKNPEESKDVLNNPRPSSSSSSELGTSQANQNRIGSRNLSEFATNSANISQPEQEVVEIEEDDELEVIHENIVHRNALPTSLFITTTDSNVLGPQYIGGNPLPNAVPTCEEERTIDRKLITLLNGKPSHFALLSILNKFSQFPHMITSYGVLYNKFREQLRIENCMKHMNEADSKCSCPLPTTTTTTTIDNITPSEVNYPRSSSSSIIGMDPVSEIPQLELWFAIHANPSENIISKYTQDLNDRPYRKKRPESQLTLSLVKSWFETRQRYETPSAKFIG